VILIARYLMPKILSYVASTRQRNLFTLAMVLACLGTAWIISSAGISLALGAFLAGIVVAGSEYRHQALADLTSFRDVFSSLFFVSIGMLLAPAAILEGIVPILLILAAILVGKFLIVSATGALMKLPLRVAVLAGVSLAQVGEFSFVMERAAAGTGLLPDPLDSWILAAAILSMLITPFAIELGPRMAAGAGKMRVLTRLLRVREAEEAEGSAKTMRDHVIIAGYGFAGEALARSLEGGSVPYIIVDLNVDNTRKAITSGLPAYFGDVTSPEVLESVGIDHARELVIVINDSLAVEQTIRAARSVSKDVYIVARTNYFLHFDRLIKAGADEVIPAEREAAVEVTARVLDRHNCSHDHVLQSITRIRGRRHD
jgi:CPA2 family monovalent cation:H+ antiporter-2